MLHAKANPNKSLYNSIWCRWGFIISMTILAASWWACGRIKPHIAPRYSPVLFTFLPLSIMVIINCLAYWQGTKAIPLNKSSVDNARAADNRKRDVQMPYNNDVTAVTHLARVRWICVKILKYALVIMVVFIPFWAIALYVEYIIHTKFPDSSFPVQWVPWQVLVVFLAGYSPGAYLRGASDAKEKYTHCRNGHS